MQPCDMMPSPVEVDAWSEVDACRNTSKWRCLTLRFSQSTASASAESRDEDVARNARLSELLDRYRLLVRRAISRVCPPGSGLSCDDIEQEAWISVWRVLQSERAIEFPASYIYKVAVTATISALRRARSRREDPLPEENVVADGVPPQAFQAPALASPDVVAAGDELKRTVAAALAQLAENRRSAVALHLQGFTTVEIGDLLHWTEAKARNLVHRGLKDLRTSLRAMGIDQGP